MFFLNDYLAKGFEFNSVRGIGKNNLLSSKPLRPAAFRAVAVCIVELFLAHGSHLVNNLIADHDTTLVGKTIGCFSITLNLKKNKKNSISCIFPSHGAARNAVNRGKNL